mgnify:CR=1 FL=1
MIVLGTGNGGYASRSSPLTIYYDYLILPRVDTRFFETRRLKW